MTPINKMNDIETKIREIMVRHFEDALDKEAPKQPNGSIERKVGLAVGSWIIAKSLPEIVALLTPDVDGKKSNLEMFDEIDKQEELKAKINDKIDRYMDKDGMWLKMTEVTRRYFVNDLVTTISFSLKPSNKPDVEELKKKFIKRFYGEMDDWGMSMYEVDKIFDFFFRQEE